MAPKNVVEPAKGRTSPQAPARDKPDPRPARLMAGASALAAVTIMGAGLVHFPPAAAEEPVNASAAIDAQTTAVKKTKKVERPVKYVRLKPGQKAPKGAKVIKEAAPTPRIIVQRVVTSAPSRATRRPVARSRQSGG
jgi:uncharacterized protein HemX